MSVSPTGCAFLARFEVAFSCPLSRSVVGYTNEYSKFVRDTQLYPLAKVSIYADEGSVVEST